MRRFLPVLFLVVVGCVGAPSAEGSEADGRTRFVDTDGDGLPDARARAAAVGVDEFVDLDDDGLPDRRAPAAVDR